MFVIIADTRANRLTRTCLDDRISGRSGNDRLSSDADIWHTERRRRQYC